MFSAEMITPFIESFFSKASVMDSYKERIAATRKAMAAADYVLIGAGAGLSAAAGLDYGGMRFKREFSEFISGYFPARGRKRVFRYYDQRGRTVPQGRICFRPSFRGAG